MGSPDGRWDQVYSVVHARTYYGNSTTLFIAASWLKDCRAIEDWGCGPSYFATLMPERLVTGIDGSCAPNADRYADLRTYRSHIDGVFMRQVMEHNAEWAKILENFFASFTRRAVLIVGTRPSTFTHFITEPDADIPALSYNLDDLRALIPADVRSVELLDVFGQEDRNDREQVFLFER